MTDPTGKSMDDITALCKRRGFIFQASEIYGGINGFWDYGPLGAQLKKNLKDAWWRDCVLTPPEGPDGRPLHIVGLDSSIIQNPKVWEASGHVAGFNDPMVDDKETKKRFRADHLYGMYLDFAQDKTLKEKTDALFASANDMTQTTPHGPNLTCVATNPQEALLLFMATEQKIKGKIVPLDSSPDLPAFSYMRDGKTYFGLVLQVPRWLLEKHTACVPSPFNKPSPKSLVEIPPTYKNSSLTSPRDFNLMFESHAGAVRDEANKIYLRPETAQGIFINFKNVMDTTRVRIPFGVAQIGKAFRNEVTPRNFTFRSREFEQMEIEFFCAPDRCCKEGDTKVGEWLDFWRSQRLEWWRSMGLSSDNLRLRDHDRDELAHYAKEGAGTSDIEYRFPFTAPGYGELEGVADRGDFDLGQHQKLSKAKLEHFDQERGERYLPNVIEPSAGADRGALALICEAFTPDPARPSKVFMKFHPRVAPIKAAVFPLVNKDGLPEVAAKLATALKRRFGAVETDAKQSIGKRYARMDEAGCPFCFTIDGDTLSDQSVTVRDRDTCEQERIAIDRVEAFLSDRLGL